MPSRAKAKIASAKWKPASLSRPRLGSLLRHQIRLALPLLPAVAPISVRVAGAPLLSARWDACNVSSVDFESVKEKTICTIQASQKSKPSSPHEERWAKN